MLFLPLLIVTPKPQLRILVPHDHSPIHSASSSFQCAALLRHSKVKPDLQTLQNEIVDLESTLYRLQQQQAERERAHQAALQDKEQEGQQALVEQKRHFQFHTKKHQGDRLDGILNNLSLENFQLRGNVAKQRLRAKDVHLELQTLRHRTEKLTINLQEARAKSKAQAAKEVELSGELEQVRDDKKNLQKECDRIKWAFQYMRQTFDQQIRTIIDKSKADVKNLSNEHKSLLESYEMDKIKLHEMDKYTEDFSHQRLVLKKLKDEARQNEDRMRAFQRELDKYKQREEQHKQTLDESTKELKKTKKHYRHAIRKLEQAYSVNGKLKAKLQEGVRV